MHTYIMQFPFHEDHLDGRRRDGTCIYTADDDDPTGFDAARIYVLERARGSISPGDTQSG